MASNLVSGTVTVKDPARIPLMIAVSSTAIPAAGTTMLMTIWQAGTIAAAGATQWPIPSEFAFRPIAVQAVINSSAVTGGTAQVIVNAATSSASFTSGSQATQGRPALLQVLVSAGPVAASVQAAGEVVAGTTLGVFVNASTASFLGGAVIHGYLYNNNAANT